MADIKINILDFCGNNHWHYEIVINGERFISGWYQYDFIYTPFKEYYVLERFPNGATEYQIKKLNNKYGLVEFTNRNWARCITHEAIDLVKGKIYESYYDILKNK
jgi:hypothetical protein